MHYNTALMEYIKTYPGFNNHLPAITNLCIALSDPEFGAKIMVANGTIEHTVTYEWGPGPSIEGKIHASRKFMAGDVVSLGLCYSYMLVGSFFGMTEVYSRKLTKEDVKNLSYPNHFPINGEMFPEMDVFGVLPPGFSDVEILAAAIVTGENDSSQSFLAPMPDMKPEYQVVSQSFDDDTHMRLVVDYPEAFVNETGLLALHCVMMYLADIENKIDREFKVEALSQDAAGNVNGIIVSPPNNYTYMTGDYSTEEGEVCVLVEGDEVIAFLNGVAEVVMMG
jgi:hypothetical protein